MAIYKAFPTADYEVSWHQSGSGDHAADVNEDPHDGDDSYIEILAGETDKIDVFETEAFDVPVNRALPAVRCIITGKYHIARPTFLGVALQIGPTVLDSQSYGREDLEVASEETDYTEHFQQWLVNPRNGEPWTREQLNRIGDDSAHWISGCQVFCVMPGNAGCYYRVTQVRLEVDDADLPAVLSQPLRVNFSPFVPRGRN